MARIKPICGRCLGGFSPGMEIELVEGKQHHAYCAGVLRSQRQGDQPSIASIWIALGFFPWLRWRT
jgi:hypothetical protein